MNNNQLTIRKENSKKRLDKFLVERLPDFSRSQIQKIIKEGQILVNNKTAPVHHWLKEGEVITLNIQKEKEAKKRVPKLDVLHEDDNFLIINKQAGIVVHPDSVHKSGTLLDALLKKYPEIKKVGDDPARPGIVHRIDKDVSGLLAIAKTPQAFKHLKKQFQKRKVKKEYLALVHGAPAKDSGVITFALGRGKQGKMAVRTEGEGRAAITKFEVIEKFINYSLLKITIKTGRTHQIRVHLNAFGHPLVGDKLYKQKKIKSKLELDRIFLHAVTLGFYDLEGKWQEFSSPLPKELEKILKELK